MIKQYSHFEFGELLARNIKAISHTDQNKRFFRATESEELEELTERATAVKSGFILVAIDGNNADYGYKNSDNLMERPQYFFQILKNTTSTNSATIFEAQTECKKIAKQIIAAMTSRSKGYYESPLQFLEKDSITIRGIGPILDNWYGVIMGFNLNYGLALQINTDEWNELPVY